MRKRISRLISFVRWLFEPPCPAIDIGSAMIAGGWCVALVVDPDFLSFPSYRSLQLVPAVLLTIATGLLMIQHLVALRFPKWRSSSCLAAAFIWLTAAAGFATTGAWTGVTVYVTLGLGSLLAAVYAEATR